MRCTVAACSSNCGSHAGILIDVFRKCEDDRQSIVGEVRLAFEDLAKVLNDRQQEVLQLELG